MSACFIEAAVSRLCVFIPKGKAASPVDFNPYRFVEPHLTCVKFYPYLACLQARYVLDDIFNPKSNSRNYEQKNRPAAALS
jgi:hypothetical protein